MIEMELYAFVYRFAGNGMANHVMGRDANHGVE
jgi:hypothetical protein